MDDIGINIVQIILERALEVQIWKDLSNFCLFFSKKSYNTIYDSHCI